MLLGLDYLAREGAVELERGYAPVALLSISPTWTSPIERLSFPAC